ncbi:MAG: aminotransferase class IV [Bacteroidetes bacterium]|nr:aminotransferase class IV [Bacteroidota bacterium]
MLQQYNPKNENIIIHVGGKLYPRTEAKISVFDSVVQGGDAIWEGLRVYHGGIFCLDRHLDRLYESAKALLFTDVPNRAQIKKAIFDTLKANNMGDGVHIRLTLTRGEKITSGMDPRLNQKGSCLIVLPEWKPLVYDNENGIKLITSAIRRNAPEFLDSKIHHNNLLNNILAKIQANQAHADAALMLDKNGFISETNDANIFMVKNHHLITPFADACLHGITRGLMLELAAEMKIISYEKNISLTEIYNADEVFCTGTMGELTPVKEIDGRVIETKSESKLIKKLSEAFVEKIKLLSEKIPS